MPQDARMFIPDLDHFALAPEEDELLEELGRRALSRGPWTAMAYLVRTRKDAASPWEGPFLWLHRYQKVAQGWKLVSRFHTTEASQLHALLDALDHWELIPRGPQAG